MKIRIGNDFRYNWLILWNEEAESFTDATDKRLTVTVYGRVTELMEGTDYTIIGNTIAIDFTPAICDKTGSYNLALQYTKPSDKFIDGDRRSAVDVDAFIIVPKSEQSDSLEDITHTSDAVATFLDVAYQKLDEIEAAEAVRETTEEGRVTAETGRVTAETGRVTAEGLRVTAEQQRAIDSAAAVENANDAATYANEQGAYAEEMSAHPPVIIADYWHNWNFTTNQYETTGQYARGDSAVEGALVVQETGQSAVNTMSQKAVTDELVQLAGDQMLMNEMYEIQNAQYNDDLVFQSANVVWFDGTVGIITMGDYNEEFVCFDSYEITYSDRIIRQPKVTRNIDGNIITKPQKQMI